MPSNSNLYNNKEIYCFNRKNVKKMCAYITFSKASKKFPLNLELFNSIQSFFYPFYFSGFLSIFWSPVRWTELLIWLYAHIHNNNNDDKKEKKEKGWAQTLAHTRAHLSFRFILGGEMCENCGSESVTIRPLSISSAFTFAIFRLSCLSFSRLRSFPYCCSFYCLPIVS